MQAVAGRAAVVALLTLTASACATAGSRAGPIRFTRADGTAVTCTRPGDDVLDDPESEGVSAAFPGLVHLLLDRATGVDVKEERMRSVASTDVSVVYLSYRLCLEFGQNVLDRAAYDEWLEQLEPRLLARGRTPRSPSP